MGFEELVEQAREAQYSHLWVDVTALKALIRERDLLKAENEALRAEHGAPPGTPARFGQPGGRREIGDDGLDSLVRKIQALESRKILDEQRMDHLDRRLDDFIARIDEIERAHRDAEL